MRRPAPHHHLIAGLPARLALLAIRAYQRHLSPLKGFSCALRAATGGESCSAYAYRVIGRRGLACGLRLLRRRFDMCALAHQQAQVQPRGLLYRQQGHLDLGCADAWCDGAGCIGDLGVVADCIDPGCDCGWPSRSGGQFKSRDTRELEKLRSRIEASKRERERERERP